MQEMKQYDNPLRRQIFDVPVLLRAECGQLKAQIAALSDKLNVAPVQRVLITGCGDSYCAGLAMAKAFEEIAGIPAEAVTAMNLARYDSFTSTAQETGQVLVIGISYSGRVPRVAEAIARMQKRGALTLALTSGAQSSLAQAAQYRISTEIPPFERSPGVRGYAVAMLVLFLLAVSFGEQNGHISTQDALHHEAECGRMVDALEVSLPAFDAVAFEAAMENRAVSCCEWIGAGHGYATSVFAREKMYEAAGIPSAVCDSEEWFHSFKFLKKFKDTFTMIFTDRKDAGNSRTTELVERITLMERSFALVTNDRTLTARFVFELPEWVSGFLAAFLELAPPALFASYTAAINEEPYSRGFLGRWRDFEGAPSTVSSKIELW